MPVSDPVDALVTLARENAYAEVIDLLDAEIGKAKDRGDLTTAETIEVLRAKVKARGVVIEG
jgi:hypothetical protein